MQTYEKKLQAIRTLFSNDQILSDTKKCFHISGDKKTNPARSLVSSDMS